MSRFEAPRGDGLYTRPGSGVPRLIGIGRWLTVMCLTAIVGACSTDNAINQSTPPPSEPTPTRPTAGTEPTLPSGQTGTTADSEPVDPQLAFMLTELRSLLLACGDDISCTTDARDSSYRACLELRGYVSTRASDGTWETSHGGDSAAFRQDAQECFRAVAGVLPRGAPDTPEHFSAYYDFLVELMECVREHGHPVPDPPSREVFIESKGAIWHPYDPRWTDAAAWEALEEVCPQNEFGW